MPLATITIVATVWAIAHSREIELKTAKATRKYGAASSAFVFDHSEVRACQSTDRKSVDVNPADECQSEPIPIAAGETN